VTDARRALAPLLAALAVVAVVLGGLAIVRSGGTPGTGSLPVLHIGSAAGGARDLAVGGGDSGRYVLSGHLPDSPTAAAVRPLTATADQNRVDALATALGLGPATRTGDIWNARSGDAVLQVSRHAGNAWSYARHGAECPAPLPDAGSDGVVSSCAIAVAPSSLPVPPLDLKRAASAAQSVLSVVDKDGCDPCRRGWVDQMSGVASYLTSPRAGGLPAPGLVSQVTVDASGVVAGGGWLGGSERGRTYPLVTAASAFDALGSGPEPMIACGPLPKTLQRGGPAPATPTVPPDEPSDPPPSDMMPMPMPCRAQVVVTGAHLGLSFAWDGRTPLLVPAWLFDVKGSAEPLIAVAVDPKYLGDPEPIGPTGGSSGGGSIGGSGGKTVPPAEPPTIAPTGPGATTAPGAGTPVPIDGASIAADGVTLQLRAGGDCGNHQKVSAGEDASTVKVSVVAAPPPPGMVEDAMCRILTVTLRQALGSRHLVDATTGAVVPVTKTL
jgi:hypothetical protein